MKVNPCPTAPNERWALLDALRGFALLGIMFVNMTWFTGFAVLSPEQRAAFASAPYDSVAYWLIHFAVDGKFWSLFALLFGVGFAIQSRRADGPAKEFAHRFACRMVVLLVIGLVHAVFIWFGDIVSLYAVVGFTLLLFRRCSARALLIWAIGFLLAPVVLSGIWLAASHMMSGPGSAAGNPAYGPEAMLVYFGSGSYAEVFHANWAFLTERWVLACYSGRFFKLLGMFLLGFWAGRHTAFEEPAKHRGLWRRVLIGGLLIGIPANAVLASLTDVVPLRPPSALGWFVAALKSVGVPALSLAITAAFVILFERETWRRRTAFLTPVGRMSLTNYLLQSVMAVALFYGFGLGFWGRIGPAASVGVILVLFVLQALFSRWWLDRFRYGPLEWVWRSFTYRRRLPLWRRPGWCGHLARP